MAKFLKLPSRRATLIWLAILLLMPITWLAWTPGADIRDGRHDLGTNGIWMQHGWMGADEWFERNNKQATRFRDPARLNETASLLKSHRIRFVFPHLCPAQPTGAIAPSDAAQVERFLDAFEGFEVLPWVGGVRGDSARIADQNWRTRFVLSCARLLEEHPRLAGVHVNIEPMPSGDPDFLALLGELRMWLPVGKKISVAAYPPPTYWQPTMDVHWDESYSRAVAARVDQAAVMMYDTSLRTPKLYEKLMKDWTREVLAWYAPKEVLLGVPAYDDVAGYHDPGTENLRHAFAGIHAGLGDSPPAHYTGVSIYCEWEMNEEKWRTYEERFEKRMPR